MPLGLLGKKLGHTRIYDAAGNVVPVTVVLCGPNRVLQVKTQAGKDGYNAVQLGFDDQKEQRLTKALLGHIKKQSGVAVKRIREPIPLQVIANITPSKWYYIIVKSIMIKGLGFSAIWKETLILAGMTLFLLTVSIRKFKIRLG